MRSQWYQEKTLLHLKSSIKTPLLWSVFCVLLMLFVFKDVAVPCYYGSPDYLNVEVGYGIKYHVTDNGGSLDCDIWAVSRTSGNDSFVFTLIQDGNGGGPFCNSWLRGSYSDDLSAYIFNAGCPAGIQSDLYALFSIPEAFESGDQWVVFDREYLVEIIGAYTVHGTVFNDCIRVTVDNTQDEDELLRGNGYFILGRNVGIVQMVFNRDDGSAVLFEYQAQAVQTLYKLCGTLSSTTGGSVKSLVIQSSNCDDSERCAVTMDGTFTMNTYGPDVVLRVGYDDDGNGEFDPDQPPDYPQEFHVNCESGVVTTRASDIALQIAIGEDCDLNDADEDGVLDEDDNCPSVSNADQANSDSDSFGDVCDNCAQVTNEEQVDRDVDGIGNVCDNCWETSNPDQLDSDDTCDTPPYEIDPACGDACEEVSDGDGDGVDDQDDNCPAVSNADQTDSDGDSFGDVCDNCSQVTNEEQIDSDEDGVGNICDNCWETVNPDQLDSDETCDTPPYEINPACGDACDIPLCGDGVDDEDDNCPAVSNTDQSDIDGDSFGDACDNCPNESNRNQVDVDDDGIGNACDNCLMVPNPDQSDSDGSCYSPPFRSDPVCGDACASPRGIVFGVLLSTIELENEAEENILDGDIEEVTKVIEDSSSKLDYILPVFVKAWESGELSSLPEGQVRRVWITLKVALNLNQMAVRMLERDQKWRRRSARVLMQWSLYCTEYVKSVLE